MCRGAIVVVVVVGGFQVRWFLMSTSRTYHSHGEFCFAVSHVESAQIGMARCGAAAVGVSKKLAVCSNDGKYGWVEIRTFFSLQSDKTPTVWYIFFRLRWVRAWANWMRMILVAVFGEFRTRENGHGEKCAWAIRSGLVCVGFGSTPTTPWHPVLMGEERARDFLGE